jgi:hypothetical protein
MTFIRYKIINGGRYAYLVTGIRCCDNKIRSYCRYLGKEGSFDEELLKKYLKQEVNRKRRDRLLKEKQLKQKEEENYRLFLKKLQEQQLKNEKNDFVKIKKEIEEMFSVEIIPEF